MDSVIIGYALHSNSFILDFVVKTIHVMAFFYSLDGFAFGTSVVKLIKNEK